MNLVNKEYKQFEEKIEEFIEKQLNELENEQLIKTEQLEKISQFPVIPQLSLNVDIQQYRGTLRQLFSLLKEHRDELTEHLDVLEQSLTEENIRQWFEEAVAVNEYYFVQFAKEHNLPEWLPFYAAENSIRPYLRKMTKEIAPALKDAKDHHGCPACGEPARLAVINKAGKKELVCPRCHWTWIEKKIKCAHCGTDEPGKIEVIKIEKDEKAEIHVCKACKGYTKVIDTRNLIKNESPGLLDINTIHLDYIAQENGYGVPEGNGVH
jgi:FdhE protein